MAKKIREKPRENTSKRKSQNGIFNRIKLTESYTSLMLGAIVVLVVGILFILFAKVNRNIQTRSIDGNSQDSNTSSSYTVNPGDDLWTISENFYNDGYKWVEIAKINNLTNPGLIYAGDKLAIPDIAQNNTQEKSVAETLDQNPQTKNSVIQNNSITEDTYTVVKDDNLWDIAVRAYGDGFKWSEIAKANNLVYPDLIHSGNIFRIPR